MTTLAAGTLRRFALTLIKIMSCYVAVAIAFLAIQAGLESPFVRMQIKRLAWSQSPFATFPFPLEPGDLDSNYFLDRSAKSLLSDLAAIMAVVGGIHLITFNITAILHRRRSIPNYWRDLEPPDAARMLLRSAQLGSWAFLLTAISQVVGRFEFESAMYGASFPFTGNLSVVAALAVSILVLLAISSRAAKSVVLERLTPADRRCLGCGHALRVATANRCPECGRPFDPAAKLDYRLKWGPVSWLITLRRPLLLFVCMVMLGAPFGLTRLLRQMPQKVQNLVPRQVFGPLGSSQHVRMAYPLRLDSVCVFQRNHQVAIIRFEYVRPEYGRYQAVHWPDAILIDKLPDRSTTGELDLERYHILDVFGWRFTVSSGGGRMIWLSSRDPAIKVKSYLMKAVPQEYRPAVESMSRGNR